MPTVIEFTEKDHADTEQAKKESSDNLDVRIQMIKKYVEGKSSHSSIVEAIKNEKWLYTVEKKGQRYRMMLSVNDGMNGQVVYTELRTGQFLNGYSEIAAKICAVNASVISGKINPPVIALDEHYEIIVTRALPYAESLEKTLSVSETESIALWTAFESLLMDAPSEDVPETTMEFPEGAEKNN